MKKKFSFLKSFEKTEVILFIIFVAISSFIMIKTFRLSSDKDLLISERVWSDFAATIPLIRSFSFGSNFPPQYPIFAGPSIRYHFIFFLLVGLLEKIGIPLVMSLNLLSIISFSLLLVIIYVFSKELFNKKSVAILSVIFFLFNGSFAFLEFFKQKTLSLNLINEIIKNDTFPSFGPYDGKVVSAFWNLNIYANQRHLAFAYFAFLALVLFIYQLNNNPKKISYKVVTIIGLIVGLFPFVHITVFGMMGILLVISFIIYPKIRKRIFFSGVLALIISFPQIILLKNNVSSVDFFNPGYLAPDLSIFGLAKYWLYNLGLMSILIPFAFLISNKSQRKVFIPFLMLFVVGNLFQFSKEIAANHKFFNLFLIGTYAYVANLLVYFWNKRNIYKIFIVIVIFFLTLSGAIDLFPVVNGKYFTVKDYPKDPTITFIVQNTSRESVFLNARFLYDPASLAGRKIYLGWPYFSWSAGYDTDLRFTKMKTLLSPTDKKDLCKLLSQENIDYVETQSPSILEDIVPNFSFFDNNFVRIYYDYENSFSIYDVSQSCKS